VVSSSTAIRASSSARVNARRDDGGLLCLVGSGSGSGSGGSSAVADAAILDCENAVMAVKLGDGRNEDGYDSSSGMFGMGCVGGGPAGRVCAADERRLCDIGDAA
jgi:hypothetical protein